MHSDKYGSTPFSHKIARYPEELMKPAVEPAKQNWSAVLNSPLHNSSSYHYPKILR
ncbi:hypothetical protein JCM19233_3351 [Vibrio astriarenae]|nr:hypothetical protein JCM19233_3351 [Vibrio sp. C7]